MKNVKEISMQDLEKNKRVAIITGGTRGIGSSISLELAKNDYIVLAVYRSNKDKAQSLLKKMQVFSSGSDIIKADISKKPDTIRVAKYAFGKWGRIDVLINNAGIFDFSFLEDMSEEFLDRIYTGNFKSQVFMIQAVLPYIKNQKFGRIVNASSISSTLSDVGLVAYAASKAGVNLMTKIAAGELAPYGITVNAYAPGIIHTDMTDMMIKERGRTQVKQIPVKYFGTGEDVAVLVKFLCSEEASYITGEIIGVDGGMLKVQNPYRAYDYVKEKESLERVDKH